ncbi:MAG: lasso peptide biosynthesis B2 protein [Acidobacteria bacterium]|nr:lasso peptide biosynthesis B2 protein [Acidobacteriota bacterium]
MGWWSSKLARLAADPGQALRDGLTVATARFWLGVTSVALRVSGLRRTQRLLGLPTTIESGEPAGASRFPSSQILCSTPPVAPEVSIAASNATRTGDRFRVIATGNESERLSRLVGFAARLRPRPFTCLPRSLVLQRLLLWRGVAATMRIGVRPARDRVAAHAWLEVDGRPVGERSDPGQSFAVLLPE